MERQPTPALKAGQGSMFCKRTQDASAELYAAIVRKVAFGGVGCSTVLALRALVVSMVFIWDVHH